MIPVLRHDAIGELDLGAERIWPPERLVLEDGWRCRLDRGVTRRANSVRPSAWCGRSPGDSFDAAIAHDRKAGAQWFFLQVEADNAAALGLYGAAGFEPVYRSHCRVLR